MRLWVSCICVVAIAFAASPAFADLSAVPDSTYVVDGAVTSVVRTPNTIYLGGSFSRIGPRTGPWVALSAAPGRHRLVATPIADGHKGRAVSAAFRIVR